MDVLTNKQFESFDYINPLTGVPYYFNTRDKKYIYGIGSNMVKTTSWYAYEVQPEDTLDKLALKFYNNPTYWWVIAYFNDIMDAFERLDKKFTILKIPQISSITFGDER